MAAPHIFSDDRPFPAPAEGFAAWSEPGRQEVSLVAGPLEKVAIASIAEKGFIVAPFATDGKVCLIRPDHHFHFAANELPSASTHFSFHLNKIETVDASGAESFERMVEEAVQVLRQDGLEKVVLSRAEQWPLPTGFNPWKLFMQLTELYPDAFVALVSLPKFGTWIGASPELLLRVKPGQMETMALAGTKPVAEANAFTAKEKKEQQMVVDYILEKLEAEQVKCKALPVEIVQAGEICHLRSRITSGETGKWQQVLKALHPTPAICGVPAGAAMDYILQHENYDRSLYGGFWGPVQEQGNASFYVNLRTMQVMVEQAVLYAGVGIVEGSEPQKEWEETVAKMQTLKKALRQYER